MAEAMSVEPAVAETSAPKSESSALILADLKANVGLIEKAVSSREDRTLARAIRQSFTLRRKLTASILRQLIEQTLSEQNQVRVTLIGYLSKVEGGDAEMGGASSTEQKKAAQPVAEVEVFLELLSLVVLIDSKNVPAAVELSTQVVERLRGLNRRSLDLLSSKVYFYYSRAYELADKLPEIRSTLLDAYRSATLRHDNHGQTMLINLLLRNYLASNLFDQADKLVSKTTLPETRLNAQLARYYYYLGRIKAVQLDYSESYNYLMQAARKAPTSTARGFRTAVYKLATIVQLLMGEIPDRSVFRQKGIQQALRPYLHLTKTVRVGDLASFRAVVDTNAQSFKADKTFTLIQRIRQNVIKTGLRKINLSYSRISFADICEKLKLESKEDVEWIVAKAIKDGVIDATIDHARGFIHTKETGDVYSTTEPAAAFHKRIQFTLNLYKDAVKALRYPQELKVEDTESAEERRKRLQEEEQEIAALEEAEDEGDL